MMKLKEIQEAAASLGNQIRAGIPLDQAVDQMALMQPDFEELWLRAVSTIRSGHPLSEVLEGVWPVALISAIRAGEQAGKSEEIFSRVEDTVTLQLELRGSMFRLAYPVGMGLVGLSIFVGYMTLVMPSLLKSLGANRGQGFVHDLCSWMTVVFVDNWMATFGGLAFGTVLLVNWVRTQEGQASILNWLLSLPVLRQALRDLYFGLWGHYMALMVSAGITTREALVLTAPVLPSGGLRDSILAFEQDLADNRSMAEAAHPKNLRADDPRSLWWPFYISNAFIVAQGTGEIDVALVRVAPPLIREGTASLNRFIAFANVAAMAVSAFFIVAPLAVYYVEIFTAIRQAG